MIAELKLPVKKGLFRRADAADPAFGFSREFFGNRFVYAVISQRARGLTIGVNLNPDGFFNFEREDCEVNRSGPAPQMMPDLNVLADELQRMLVLAHSGGWRDFHSYRNLPAHLMHLRQVALGGDGEPTLSPDFLEAVRIVVHARAMGQFPFFKLVLMTNASGLDLRPVQDGLKLFTSRDEVWAGLGTGTPGYQERVNDPDHPGCSLEKTLENILLVARQRPVVIQSLFPLLNQEEPSPEEIELYAWRLNALKCAGAQIPLVQIYSATRSGAHSRHGHLPLKTLVRIARTVREISGLKAEVF